MMLGTSVFIAALLVAMDFSTVDAFVRPQPAAPPSPFIISEAASPPPALTATRMIWPPVASTTTVLYSEPNDTNNDVSQQEQLSRLGFKPEEIQTKRREEPIKVQVNEVGNVDAATLTAVGFGLIAFNFFVLANLGDGGIAGTVATILNKLKE
jgi:hypothetical protein